MRIWGRGWSGCRWFCRDGRRRYGVRWERCGGLWYLYVDVSGGFRSDGQWGVGAFIRLVLSPKVCNTCVWTNALTPNSRMGELDGALKLGAQCMPILTIVVVELFEDLLWFFGLDLLPKPVSRDTGRPRSREVREWVKTQPVYGLESFEKYERRGGDCCQHGWTCIDVGCQGSHFN